LIGLNWDKTTGRATVQNPAFGPGEYVTYGSIVCN